MPRYIVRLVDRKTDRSYWMEWSTIVDAPVSYGMPLEEFLEHYKNEYGEAGDRELMPRIRRVLANGTSCAQGTSVADLIDGNRAGPKEKTVDLEYILEHFCRNRDADEVTIGSESSKE